jgi:hypothetical protein
LSPGGEWYPEDLLEYKLASINTKKKRKELKAYVSYKSLDRLDANTGARVDWDRNIESSSH